MPTKKMTAINRSAFLFVFLFPILLFSACTHQKTAPDVPTSYDERIAQARRQIEDRHHSAALDLLESARKQSPERPEWAYEKARALFAMGRFGPSAQACRQALERDPDFYDALALSWAARLEGAHLADDEKEKIRSEIALLLKQETSVEALLAAHAGYVYLNDEPAQQQVMLKLAARSGDIEKRGKDEIAPALFEQIIGARDSSERQVKRRLMEAYAAYFPEARFADYVVYRFLQEKQASGGKPVGIGMVLASNQSFLSGSWRQRLGVARWLVEQEAMPEKAIELLQQSLEMAEAELAEKPPYFTDDLWRKERDRQVDRIHLLLGRAWLVAEKPDQAEAELAPLAEKGCNRSDVYHYLGRIARMRQENDLAIDRFRQALEIEPREDSAVALRELLEECRGYRGDPVRYFLQTAGGISFSDVTQSAGLGDVRASRVAWGDYDGDGFADVLFDGHRLFRNTGSGRFVEQTDAAGLGCIEKASGGIWGDYDNDGAVDLFVFARKGNRLFRNNGEGTFREKTAEAFGPAEARPSEAAAWGDLENDGDLDLYVANYERRGVMRAIGTHDRLYRNDGNGTFSDVSRAAGIEPDEAMCGRGVCWSDIDSDGFQEIVVANYRLDPNFCWQSRQADRLVDAADACGVRGTNVAGAFGHSIGPVSGDLDNDGRIDLLISNLAHPRYIEYSDQDMILINRGPSDDRFADRYAESGIAFEETNSDPALADVDNDGDLDLYISSIYPGRYAHLYINDGSGHFADVSWQSRTRVANSWGTGFADFDHDGFADLLVASRDGVRLFRNDGNANHWVRVIVADTRCNHQGIGCRITVSYNGRQQIREIAAGRGTGSQDEAAVIFGLGEYSGPVAVSARTLCGDNLRKTLDSPDRTVILSGSGPVLTPR